MTCQAIILTQPPILHERCSDSTKAPFSMKSLPKTTPSNPHHAQAKRHDARVRNRLIRVQEDQTRQDKRSVKINPDSRRFNHSLVPTPASPAKNRGHGDADRDAVAASRDTNVVAAPILRRRIFGLPLNLRRVCQAAIFRRGRYGFRA